MKAQQIPFKENEPLAPYTSLRIGGKASLFVTPESVEDLQALIHYLREQKLSFAVMGRGSNLLVPDQGFDGCVICTRGLTEVEVSGCRIRALAGTPLATLAKIAFEHDLTGMEFCIGIPGTVGGALYTNAGVKKHDIASILASGKVLAPPATIEQWQKKDFHLSYRQSVLRQMKWIALEATFELKKGDKKTIETEMNKHLEIRKKTQPLSSCNCGSIFKNPLPLYAGALIEKAGLKGCRVGGIEISSKHANFFINTGGGTCREVECLIKIVQREVQKKFQVKLELEVQRLVPWR